MYAIWNHPTTSIKPLFLIIHLYFFLINKGAHQHRQQVPRDPELLERLPPRRRVRRVNSSYAICVSIADIHDTSIRPSSLTNNAVLPAHDTTYANDSLHIPFPYTHVVNLLTFIFVYSSPFIYTSQVTHTTQVWFPHITYMCM